LVLLFLEHLADGEDLRLGTQILTSH
jgi:hypothetical protein